MFNKKITTEVKEISDIVKSNGGKCYAVGGCVRDMLLDIIPNDFDLEVYGLSCEELITILSPKYEVDAVGQCFGVLKLKGINIDIALPRTESKVGIGHKDFKVTPSSSLTLREASLRRDFTINSLSYDIDQSQLIDTFDGYTDLKNKVLRHVSDKFSEDPLRVLRGMQFIARFGLTPHPDTVELCKTIPFEGLSKERVFEEFKKLLLKGNDIKAGLEFLEACDWLKHFPLINALTTSQQSPDHHPEGNVAVHTYHCLNHFAKHRIGNDEEDLIVGLAVLVHDIGKPATYTCVDGNIHNYGHDVAGVPIAKQFLETLTNSEDLINAILPLVRWHMAPGNYFRAKSGDKAIRRMSIDVKRIDRLIRVCEADSGGRPPIPFDDKHLVWLLERAQNLKVDKAPLGRIMKGRHLVDRGLTPGQGFGLVLDILFADQIEGKFSTEEEGIAYLAMHIEDLLQENKGLIHPVTLS